MIKMNTKKLFDLWIIGLKVFVVSIPAAIIIGFLMAILNGLVSELAMIVTAVLLILSFIVTGWCAKTFWKWD